MKPLLIIPPAPDRWPSLATLTADRGELWLEDLKLRFNEGVKNAEDAVAIVPDGGRVLALGMISKSGEIGVLSQLATDPAYQRRGFARMLLQTLLSWFEMTGGRWLYAVAPAGLVQTLFADTGFKLLHTGAPSHGTAAAMLRAAVDVPDEPPVNTDQPLSIRDLTRADWPQIVAFLQKQTGPDPRVPSHESALLAPEVALELLHRQEHEMCVLKGAFRGPRLVALASGACEGDSTQTYAVLIPHKNPPAELRQAILKAARQKGYDRIEFPMEALTTETADTGKPASD